ncbi:TAFII55 protein conserved region-domain-containing protein [Phellopilus nigrolimitatus]|nr:TAFII55 protein conserved region-domain-containing protein [Phellopilus nigrolimitatus]
MDDDDLIVVDDEPAHEASGSESVDAQAFYGRAPRTIAESVTMRSSRRRSTPPVGLGAGGLDRTTRSSHAKPKSQPKLKLKLSDKATAAMASGTSFLGAYDRELDSDDEDLTFEEQFILRMPPGEDCEKLRKLVSSREASNDIWFKFKDSRRAVFHIDNSLYSAKLVDLPCIIESQKTLDNKQMFKVADICQMLVLGDKIESEEVVANQKGFNIDEFIWPHGITPPLHHVRKRRFRKRVNKRTIETVEQEVERLLEEDAKASQVKYDVLENVNPDLSDSEFVETEVVPLDLHEPGHPGSDAIDGPTPGTGADGESADEEEEGDIDEELAAELDLALGDDGEDADEEDGEDGDEDDEDASDEEDEDEDEDDETVQARRLLNEEIRDLEAAVAKKNTEIASSANPLIRRRFEDALKKLQADLDSKLLQRDELSEQQRMRKEGFIAPREYSEANEDVDDSADMDVE